MAFENKLSVSTNMEDMHNESDYHKSTSNITIRYEDTDNIQDSTRDKSVSINLEIISNHSIATVLRHSNMSLQSSSCISQSPNVTEQLKFAPEGKEISKNLEWSQNINHSVKLTTNSKKYSEVTNPQKLTLQDEMKAYTSTTEETLNSPTINETTLSTKENTEASIIQEKQSNTKTKKETMSKFKQSLSKTTPYRGNITTSIENDRRFFNPQRPIPGDPKRIQKDPKIERLLAEYRGLVHKFGPNAQSQNSQPQSSNNNANQQPMHMPNQQNAMGSGWEQYRAPNAGGYGRYWPNMEGQPTTPRAKQTGGLRQGLGDFVAGGGGQEYKPGDDVEEIQGPEGGGGGYGGGGGGGDSGGGEGVGGGGGAGGGGPPTGGPPQATPDDGKRNEAAGAATRFTTRRTTTKRRRRTTPDRITLQEECDYLAYYCLKAYDTGMVCGRTLFFNHMTFQNYCMLDFVNCMERYDIWQIAHMGECFTLKILTEYLHYPYNDDYFLDNYYIVEDM